MLLDLLQKIFEKDKMPEEWRDSVIVPIFKEKWDIQDCGNYRGINIISHTMKIWERIIDRRLRPETSIGEEQFGFMPGRGTTDAIFAARQVIGPIETPVNAKLSTWCLLTLRRRMTGYHGRKYGSSCLREQGVPEKYVRLVKDTYEDARAESHLQGETVERERERERDREREREREIERDKERERDRERERV